MIASNRPPRGFTLIELMVVVAIIGILSSVALPSFQRASLRSKAAERRTIMIAIQRAVEETCLSQQHLPTWDPSNPGAAVIWFGAPNPPSPPGVGRVPFDWTLAGWNRLPMVVEGGSYYQYWFLALDVPATRTTLLIISATGDLDGDGMPSQRILQYNGVGYSFQKTLDWPDPGVNEDIF